MRIGLVIIEIAYFMHLVAMPIQLHIILKIADEIAYNVSIFN